MAEHLRFAKRTYKIEPNWSDAPPKVEGAIWLDFDSVRTFCVVDGEWVELFPPAICNAEV